MLLSLLSAVAANFNKEEGGDDNGVFDTNNGVFCDATTALIEVKASTTVDNSSSSSKDATKCITA